MWPFNRRKKQLSNLPPEVQAYSQAEHRERIGMAWLVGLVSLIVSLAVLASLFFGGRWVYRKIAHKNNKPVPVVTTDSTSDDNKKPGTTEDTTKTKPTPTPTTTPVTPTTPTTTPNTGDQQQTSSTSTLPNTGSDD